MLSVASRNDRARWITALTYKERQWQGITNKGGECGVGVSRGGCSPVVELVCLALRPHHGVPGVPSLGARPRPLLCVTMYL